MSKSRDYTPLELNIPRSGSEPWSLFQFLANQCHELELFIKLADLNFVVVQIQLALYYNIICKEAVGAGGKTPDKKKIAERLKILYDRFRDWIETGMQLTFIAAASIILFLLKALNGL
ncbi:hypothetical protein C0995_012151 [Termitomyces sp. Mi166|nr:hypothetical protein C0995_012151 [Termitomyces sp. Mi166\